MADYKDVDLNQYPQILQDFAQYKLDMECSKNTISDYLMDLTLFLQYITLSRAHASDFSDIHQMDIMHADLALLDSIKPNEVRDFLTYTNLQRNNSAATRARKLSAIKSLYHFLNGRYFTDYNPCLHIQTPKKNTALPKFLTLKESVTLLDCIKNDVESKTRERDYAIVTLFLNCGMRLSELVGIDLNDMDSNMETLHVTGKGNKERLLYLNDACRAALKAYFPVRAPLAAQAKTTDRTALFLSSRSRRISQKTVQWMVYKYLDLAGLGNRSLSVHKLRHTAATLMYQEGGVDVRVLKDILGHEQLNTTQIYTHVSNRQLQNAIAANPLSDQKPPRPNTVPSLNKEPSAEKQETSFK